MGRRTSSTLVWEILDQMSTLNKTRKTSSSQCLERQFSCYACSDISFALLLPTQRTCMDQKKKPKKMMPSQVHQRNPRPHQPNQQNQLALVVIKPKAMKPQQSDRTDPLLSKCDLNHPKKIAL